MPKANGVAAEPKVRVAKDGKVPSRTYRYLLESPHDMRLLEHLVTGQVVLIDVFDGKVTKIGFPNMVRSVSMAPGEQHFKAEFKKIVDLYDEAKPLLPQETEVSDVLGQVEAAARRNGLTLTGLQAVKESVKSPSAEKLYEREIPAIVTGPYPQVVHFFADISRIGADLSLACWKSTRSPIWSCTATAGPITSSPPRRRGPAGLP